MGRFFDRSRAARRFGLAAVVLLATIGAAAAQTTPQDSAAAQPKLPGPQKKPGSPVVETLVTPPQQPALEVRKRPITVARRRTRYARHRHRQPVPLDRPALAGVELLAPIPPPGEPPHVVVPMPAYPLDSIATALLMPAPPVVCHRVRREPGLPDPRLYREVTVACEPDNP